MAVFPSAITFHISTGTTTVWEDISNRVVTAFEAEMGMSDESYETRLADPGFMSFHLDNRDEAYTPSANFGKGTKVKLEVTYDGKTRTKFYGTIDEADIDIGTSGERRVRVSCVDWLKYPLEQLVREREVETSKRMDEGINGLLDDVPIRPVLTLIDQGNTTFPTIYDQIDRQTTVYREMNNIIISEYGYGYMDMGGERLRVENKDARGGIPQVATIPSDESGYLLLASGTSRYLELVSGGRLLLNHTQEAIFSGTFAGMADNPKVVHGKHVLNEVEFIVYPKKVDSSTITLFELQEPIFIPENGTKRFTGFFSDPNSGEQIGGTQLVPLVTGTHYSAHQYETASGTVLTSNLTISTTTRVNNVEYVVENGGEGAWLTTLIQKGKGIYPYSPINTIAENDASKDQYGIKSLSIRQPYQQTLSLGEQESEKILDIERTPRNVLITAKFKANATDLNMQAFLHLDIGDLIQIINPKPELNSYYHINGMKWRIEQGGEIDVVYLCKERPSFVPIAIEFSDQGSNQNAIDYGLASQLSNLGQATFCCWINLKAITQAPIIGKYSNTEIKVLFLFQEGFVRWVQTFSGNDGQWRSPSILTGTAAQDKWVHLAVTYDAGNVANDPIIYVTGSSVSLVEEITPGGTAGDDRNVRFLIGNSTRWNEEYGYDPHFVIKDARVYNRILPQSEITLLANSENNVNVVTNGLVWNAPFVRSFRYDEFVDTDIEATDPVFDRVRELSGEPHWNTTVTGTYNMFWRDPTASSY